MTGICSHCDSVTPSTALVIDPAAAVYGIRGFVSEQELVPEYDKELLDDTEDDVVALTDLNISPLPVINQSKFKSWKHLQIFQ